MTFVLLALVTHQRHVDRLELRAGGAQLSSVVFQDPNPISDHDPPFKTLYLNGRATTITVPSDYEVKVIGRNRAGQVIAEVGLDTVQGEPMLWDSFHGFWMTTARGKAEVLPQGGDMIDDRGRVFSCPMNEQPMMPIDSPHLFMWQNGKTRDLGPAYGWRLHKDGAIDGYYVVVGEAAIEPYNFLGQDDIQEMRDADLKKFRFRRFVWKHGRRVESKKLETNLPFSAAGSKNWWP